MRYTEEMKRQEAIECLQELGLEVTEEAIAEHIGYGEEFDRMMDCRAVEHPFLGLRLPA